MQSPGANCSADMTQAPTAIRAPSTPCTSPLPLSNLSTAAHIGGLLRCPTSSAPRPAPCRSTFFDNFQTRAHNSSAAIAMWGKLTYMQHVSCHTLPICVCLCVCESGWRLMCQTCPPLRTQSEPISDSSIGQCLRSCCVAVIASQRCTKSDGMKINIQLHYRVSH